MVKSAMNSARRCPICGRELAHVTSEGLCLACLLKAGIEEPEEVNAESSVQAEERPESMSSHFFGDYQLLREVGRGGMGIVYEARQFGTQRTVALKLLTAGALATREAIHRFHTEAQAAALLEHPNIVPIYEVGMHDGQYFLAMRFLGGGTLAEIAAREPLSPQRIAGMMQEIAAAVHFAHTRGVLHRDLKPSNILLSETGVPFVSDFGLARIMAVDDRMTLSTSLLGTAAYMAPEQIMGGATSSTRSRAMSTALARCYMNSWPGNRRFEERHSEKLCVWCRSMNPCRHLRSQEAKDPFRLTWKPSVLNAWRRNRLAVTRPRKNSPTNWAASSRTSRSRPACEPNRKGLALVSPEARPRHTRRPRPRPPPRRRRRRADSDRPNQPRPS